MRGNAQVIDQLNLALREELTAINQYFLHAEMCHNWGYHGLGDYIKKSDLILLVGCRFGEMPSSD